MYDILGKEMGIQIKARELLLQILFGQFKKEGLSQIISGKTKSLINWLFTLYLDISAKHWHIHTQPYMFNLRSTHTYTTLHGQSPEYTYIHNLTLSISGVHIHTQPYIVNLSSTHTYTTLHGQSPEYTYIHNLTWSISGIHIQTQPYIVNLRSTHTYTTLHCQSQ